MSDVLLCSVCGHVSAFIDPAGYPTVCERCGSSHWRLIPDKDGTFREMFMAIEAFATDMQRIDAIGRLRQFRR